MAKRTVFDGQLLTLSSVTAAGLTVQDIENFFDPSEYAANLHLLSSSMLTLTQLPDEDGTEV